MDKRSLLFFVCLTVALFGVNLFFTHRQHEVDRQWYAQQKQRKLLKQKELSASIQRRTLPATALHVVELYDQPGSTAAQLAGLEFQEIYWFLSKETALPKCAVRKKGNGNKTVIALCEPHDVTTKGKFAPIQCRVIERPG